MATSPVEIKTKRRYVRKKTLASEIYSRQEQYFKFNIYLEMFYPALWTSREVNYYNLGNSLQACRQRNAYLKECIRAKHDKDVDGVVKNQRIRNMLFRGWTR